MHGTRLEPIMLKNLPIIPSRTSQKFYPLLLTAELRSRGKVDDKDGIVERRGCTMVAVADDGGRVAYYSFIILLILLGQ